MYLVTAYRWGWTNYSQYIVYCGPDETKALALASSECSDRGGKYGCAVERFDADGTDSEQIAYFPSAYGEDEQHNNYRMDYLESLGMRVEEWIDAGKALLPDPEKPGTLKYTEKDAAPKWLVTEVARIKEHHDMVERIYREAREKRKAQDAIPTPEGEREEGE